MWPPEMKKPPNGGDYVFCEAFETRGFERVVSRGSVEKSLLLLFQPLFPGGDCAFEESDQGFM